MSFALRRALYLSALLACMVLAGWDGTYDAWRAVAGDGIGTSLAVFWDLQVETYVNVLTLALVLDLVYGLRRIEGQWAFTPRSRPIRLLAYAAMAVLTLACAAQGPLQTLLQVPLPTDIGASVALYFRRGLEAVLATLGVMVFLDLLRPAGLTPIFGSRQGGRCLDQATPSRQHSS